MSSSGNKQNRRQRKNESFEQGLLEPLIRRGEDKNLEMKEFRSSSIKRKPGFPLLMKPPEERKRDAATFGQVLKFAFPILWQNSPCCIRFQVVLAFFFLLLSRLVNVFSPIALKFAVQGLTIISAAVTSSSAISFSSIRQVINSVLLQASNDSWATAQSPTFWVCIYVMLRFLSAIFSEFRNIFFAKGQAICETGISEYVMNHVQRQSMAFHLQRETGKILRIVSRGALSFSTVIRTILFQIIPIIIEVILVLIIFLVSLQWYFCVITLTGIIIYLIATYFIQEWRNGFFKKQNEKDNQFNQKATDGLLNFQTVKYFNAEDHEARRFSTALTQYRAQNVKVALSLSVINLVQQFIINSTLLINLLLACYRLYEDELDVGDFVLINTYLLQLFVPLNLFGTYWRMIRQSMVDIDMVFELLDQDDRIPQPMVPIVPKFKTGKVEFKNVSFTYDKPWIQNPRMILKNVSFTVEPGQSVAIVGPTGSGKSTIMRLLYRFYDVGNGYVELDGYDIRTMKSKDLRSAIAIVPQDCVLFNDTIQYNIGYGGVSDNHNSTQNMYEIQAVARRAKIIDFILDQRDDWKTRVGERGLKLSGGQKQRVAIARALLKKGALIYCFDQATSALDTQTQRQIQDSINQVSKGTTTLIIAHRLSTIKDCDKIVVLKNGIVVETGKHDELLQMDDGVYRKLWEEQIKKQEENKEEEQQEGVYQYCALDQRNPGHMYKKPQINNQSAQSDKVKNTSVLSPQNSKSLEETGNLIQPQ